MNTISRVDLKLPDLLVLEPDVEETLVAEVAARPARIETQVLALRPPPADVAAVPDGAPADVEVGEQADALLLEAGEVAELVRVVAVDPGAEFDPALVLFRGAPPPEAPLRVRQRPERAR
jgi:hypothetical protein